MFSTIQVRDYASARALLLLVHASAPRALCADPRAACGGVAYAQRLTSLHTHIAWDMDDGGYTTQAEQDGPYGANDWHCES
jgi:hypothetical protein